MPIAIDDVITGALVNALSLAGRRLSVAASDHTRRIGERDMGIARWFETFRLTATPPPLSEHLAPILGDHEFQAGLHELLAARLTDATETYPEKARAVLIRTLTSHSSSQADAESLASYYDDQICDLVARIEADDPPVLAQIRSEAFATRMINILHAIERHGAALVSRPDRDAETRFLDNYRHHVMSRHGYLEPPDFQRRRRIPIADIYVPTAIFTERAAAPPPRPRSLDVWRLAGVLDRSVLLGDPGGGKTTAAAVLMHHFASDPTGRIPFLVTLREFAVQDPPERSIAGYIEHTLETLYQCVSPRGLVEGLLLTARAVVIFDGLDELLDTSRRTDVSSRVEEFCVEYPQIPVLVTSRLVGYDHARLDDSQFICYRLGGFREAEVGRYARKWFALAPGAQAADADAFLAESVGVSDLRSNPLLLSLLCILYRGAGTLPQDRDEIYAKCADLLIRDWDDYRRIRRELRVGRKAKPLLRQLAWWLFTKAEGVSAVTERLLIAKTAGLLRSSFESEDDALDAAREFVEFCHGRMWVFTYAGTTAAGEKLYAFTHRTFLEYFSAAHLAADNDSPEQLAAVLAPHVARGEWSVVAELAIQIKDRAATNGAARVYAALLSYRENPGCDARVLLFLATCLRSVDPTPSWIRRLTSRLFREFAASLQAPTDPTRFVLRNAFWALLNQCGSHREAIAAEISLTFMDTASSGDRPEIVASAWVLSSLPDVAKSSHQDFWASWVAEFQRANAMILARAATDDLYVRANALRLNIISTEEALEMPGGLDALLQPSEGAFLVSGPVQPLGATMRALLSGWAHFGTPDIVTVLEAVGDFLTRHPELPWFTAPVHPGPFPEDNEKTTPTVTSLRPTAFLAAAAMVAGLTEAGEELPSDHSPLDRIRRYIESRRNPGSAVQLPDLPVPEMFRQVFRDWAAGRVNVTSQKGDIDQR